MDSGKSVLRVLIWSYLSFGLIASVYAQTTPAEIKVDLSDFRTVDNAIVGKIEATKASSVGQSGYLGVSTIVDKKGRHTITEVEPTSPAGKAGLLSGDVLVKAGNRSFRTSEEFRDWLKSQSPGTELKLNVERDRKQTQLEIKLEAASRPRRLQEERAVLGLTLAEGTDEGARVTRVARGTPADTAGIRPGELLVKVDGVAVTEALKLDDTVGEKRPGQDMALTFRRADKDEEVKVTLGSAPVNVGGQGDPGNDRRTRFTKDVYRLAVIRVEYPDVKHNDAIKTADWEESLYTKGTYTGKNCITGQPVYGSLNDFYLEQSSNAMHVEGKVFDWVEVSKNRADYSLGNGTGPMRAKEQVRSKAMMAFYLSMPGAAW